MTWTAKPPTRDGNYGWRRDMESPPRLARVSGAFVTFTDTMGLYHRDADKVGGLWWTEPLRLPWESQPTKGE
jgi:hypothetical protein